MPRDAVDTIDTLNRLMNMAQEGVLFRNTDMQAGLQAFQHFCKDQTKLDVPGYDAAFGAASQALLLVRGDAEEHWESALNERVVEFGRRAIETLSAPASDFRM